MISTTISINFFFLKECREAEYVHFNLSQLFFQKVYYLLRNSINSNMRTRLIYIIRNKFLYKLPFIKQFFIKFINIRIFFRLGSVIFINNTNNINYANNDNYKTNNKYKKMLQLLNNNK